MAFTYVHLATKELRQNAPTARKTSTLEETVDLCLPLIATCFTHICSFCVPEDQSPLALETLCAGRE